MPAYLVANLDVTDPQGFEDYRAAVPAVVEKFGGRYLVRGGAIETIEGALPNPRLVIIAFDSMAQAKQFYDSPDYRAILPLRLKSAAGTLVFAEGL